MSSHESCSASRIEQETCVTGGASAEGSAGEGSAAIGRALAEVLAAADELGATADMDQMLRRAVELAREQIGLERVGLYLRDPRASRVILRGTWGTGASGETIDEHRLYHECEPGACELYLGLARSGSLWRYHDRVPRFAEVQGRTIPLGHGWLVATPLIAGGDLVGVMYNDSVLSHAPLDAIKQTQAAVFCGLLAALVLPRRALFTWPEPGSRRPSPVVRRVVHALDQNPRSSGESLARQLSVSPSYLARSFKAEMGVSLVEYRNRRLMERFFKAVDGGGNLLSAALAAGFGSYTQFHRVYRRMFGKSPREHLRPPRAACVNDAAGSAEDGEGDDGRTSSEM